jgi:peptidoglycan/xylan/chitin deacetylase (PgdA/CDA1 family)
MTWGQVQVIANAGMEIGAHTITHPHLPQLTPAQQEVEMRQSRDALASAIGRPVTAFATPFGEYDASVLSIARTLYTSHRTVAPGYNNAGGTDPYALRVQDVYITTTRAEVEGWLAQARAQNAWLILVFHNVVNNGGLFDTTPAMFDQYLDAVAASGLPVRTVSAGL